MLACMGCMAPGVAGKWPGDLSLPAGLAFAGSPHGLVVVSKLPALGWLQALAWGGSCELPRGESVPGSGGFGSNRLSFCVPEVVDRELNAELAYGSLGMLAVIGRLSNLELILVPSSRP